MLTTIFTLAVYSGLQKGIKFLGDVNMWVFVAVFLFVFIFGPTLFLVNLTTTSIGQYFANFLPLSLYTAPGVEGNWLGDWTVFYWAWWISWSPFVALFIARISRGRTIRKTVAAALVLPTLADFLWYGVVGGAGIHFDVTDVLAEHGVESAVFATAQHLPLTGVLAVALLFLIATFFLTSANSAALALSMSFRERRSGSQPASILGHRSGRRGRRPGRDWKPAGHSDSIHCHSLSARVPAPGRGVRYVQRAPAIPGQAGIVSMSVAGPNPSADNPPPYSGYSSASVI